MYPFAPANHFGFSLLHSVRINNYTQDQFCTFGCATCSASLMDTTFTLVEYPSNLLQLHNLTYGQYEWRERKYTNEKNPSYNAGHYHSKATR